MSKSSSKYCRLERIELSTPSICSDTWLLLETECEKNLFQSYEDYENVITISAFTFKKAHLIVFVSQRLRQKNKTTTCRCSARWIPACSYHICNWVLFFHVVFSWWQYIFSRSRVSHVLVNRYIWQIVIGNQNGSTTRKIEVNCLTLGPWFEVQIEDIICPLCYYEVMRLTCKTEGFN